MAVNQNRQEVSLPAAADYTSAQFRIVGVSGGSAIALVNAATAVLGILTNKPNSGQEARVCTTGICKLEAGAAVTAGSLIVAVAGGRGSQAATANGTNFVGLAVTGADGSASIFEVAVNPFIS